MRMRASLFLIASAFFGLLFLSAMKAQANENEAPAQVSFTLDFPGSTPDHYSVTVASSGKANYISGKPDSKPQSDSSSDADSPAQSDSPYQYQFTVSEATRARIFALAKQASYFKGNLDYGKGKIASTGAKTLAYKDAHQSTSATYNYSNKSAVEELTRLFQSMAATLEFGRRLDYLHHYQKLALEEELKRMEEMANQHELEELQAVAPVLKKIFDDPTVMNVSRARAERLLAKTGGNSSAQ